MIPPINVRVIVLLITGLLVFACDSKSPVQTTNEISTVNPQISDCGGFISYSEKRTVNSVPFIRDPETYCNAEKLLWLYEESTQTLKVMNARVLLNCCGDRKITAVEDYGIIVISEDDQPEGGTERCKCVCVYDFYIEISGITPGIKTVKLELTVDDATSTKWEGKIDIRNKSGEIIIDGNPLSGVCP